MPYQNKIKHKPSSAWEPEDKNKQSWINLEYVTVPTLIGFSMSLYRVDTVPQASIDRYVDRFTWRKVRTWNESC